jgi:aerobic-type carbon monoxide dehydrogenase small subunit (CoxS/CutS family)
MAMTLNVNGTERRVEAPADEPLLYVLRDYLGLTGAKYGCGEGHCGACTVIIDGEAVRSCQTRAGYVGGRRIRTIEGLADGDRLHPVQQAFLGEEAMQCGYCTPGMIMAAVALLGTNASPSKPDIARALQRNVCRCGTYPRIVAAVERAATATRPTAARGGRR